MTHWWKRISSLSLLVALTACWSGWSERTIQSGTVRGRVMSTNGYPVASLTILYVPLEVPGVTVFEDKGLQTGPQGEYAIVLPAGMYTIAVNTPHGRQSQQVTVLPGQVTVADFTIERSVELPHLGWVSHCAEEVRPPTRALGDTLGQTAIGMSAEELQAVLGQPERVIAMPDIVPLQWMFRDGTRVTFMSVNGVDIASEISTHSPTLGVTVEGLTIGTTLDDFGQMYQDFSVCSHSARGFLVIGSNDRWLGVGFGEDNRVSGLTVASKDPRPGQVPSILGTILSR